MSLQSVRDHFDQLGLDLPILETTALTPTVELAALAHGVEPGRIAKTLAFRLGDGRVVLLVASGHARIDNAKFKTALGKGKMLPTQEVEHLTGHPVGGVFRRSFVSSGSRIVWVDVRHPDKTRATASRAREFIRWILLLRACHFDAKSQLRPGAAANKDWV